MMIRLFERGAVARPNMLSVQAHRRANAESWVYLASPSAMLTEGIVITWFSRLATVRVLAKYSRDE